MTVTNRAKFYSTVLHRLFYSQKLAGFRLRTADRAARHLSLGLQLVNPTELDRAIKLAEPVGLASNTENVLVQRRAGLIIYQFQLNSGFWETYTRQDLPNPNAIGLGERRKPVEFDFSEPHTLVAGSTGSGKTECIKTILLSLLAQSSPEHLKLVITDPNRMLTDFQNSVYLALPIAHSSEDISNSILYCQEQLISRKSNGFDHRLVLVLDEATETTTSDLAVTKTLVKQGRAFEVNVILGTQKPSQSALPDIVDQLLNKFVGKLANAHLSAAVTGHSGVQAHKLTGRGDFIHITTDPTRFQVALSGDSDFRGLERGEIEPVTVGQIEPVELLDIRPAGRPKLTVQPDILARYFHLGPQNISITQAANTMGLSRDNHNLHKTFCLDFITAYRSLR